MTAIIPSQTRLPLRTAIQAAAQGPISTLVADQFAPAQTASFTVDPEMDEYPVDTASGSVTATLPLGAKCFPGKPYTFRKKSASNSLIVAFNGGELYEGAATITVTDDNAVISIKYDPISAEWVRAGAVGAGGAVPAGAVAKTDTQSFGPFDLSLIGATADKMRFYPGFACVVTGVVSAQSKGTVATGAATTTLTTTAGAPTGNTITHALTETVNQKKTMTPTGVNCVVGATDFIELAVTGSNDGANSKAGYTVQYYRT